ncbi:AGAP002904-PA-like protein [Anopheles sinensis]|uniref:AGAP002904-PA-like protein n=1 Tax=Anopheles sinensis TaxID=74873 RepID=A0A084VE37_ANOSI|nr:AGAP002904-PA-like protein [Anopheles sinensis]
MNISEIGETLVEVIEQDVFYSEFQTVVNKIFAQYLVQFFCTCIVLGAKDGWTIASESFPHPFTVIDFEDVNIVESDVLLQAIDNGCQSFVVAQSVATQFLDQFHPVHDRAVTRFPEKRLIVIGDATNVDGDGILNHSAIGDVIDLLFVQPRADLRRVDLLTGQFELQPTERDGWIVLDSFNLAESEATKPLVNLFPNKRIDLRGRFLRLAIFNYEPYTIWKDADSAEEANAYYGHHRSLSIDGTEAQLFIEFCAKLNCSLEISLDEAGEWGQIFDNRTGDGIIGALVERRADVGVGALYSWYHEFRFLSLSKPISRTGVTCIAPKPLPLSSWMTPILPFTLVLWLAVLGSFLVAIVFDVLFSFVTHKFTPSESGRVDICESVMAIMSIFILQAVLMRINKNQFVSQMILIGTFLLVGLMVGNAYSGGLSSVMTVPRYEKSIDTVQELADRNLRWGSTHDAWIFSIQLATQPTIVKLLNNFLTAPKEVLHRNAIERNMAYSIERLPYGHFAIGEYITEQVSPNFEIMLEDIYWENCVAMATKTWPLMNELDELTLVIFQSGIQRFWENKVVSKFADNKVQHAISTSRHFDNPGPIALQPSHLLGAFLLLAFGLGLGLVCFACELLWHRLSYRPSTGTGHPLDVTLR